jgi:predicted outer membrane repeat protein
VGQAAYNCSTYWKEHGHREVRTNVKLAAVLPFLLWVAMLLTPAMSTPRTWYITPDGTGDAPTIHAGLDSAAVGDTVSVACGTYYESGISMKSGVVLVSETGLPECATIDAEGTTMVIVCINCLDPTEIVGFTLKNGWLPWWGYGGGIFCVGCTDLRISHCTFLNNHADFGGGLSCEGTVAEVSDCVFGHNSAVSLGGGLNCMNDASVQLHRCVFDSNSAGYGGGVACGTATLSVENCTFFGNRAYANEYSGEPGGGGVYIFGQSHSDFKNTIVASSVGGEGIWCDGDNIPEVWCCDIYGNADGDWVGCLAGECGVDGNFSADPKFCDTMTGDFRVETCSPCLPENHPDGYNCGMLIGVRGSGCGCGAVTNPTAWGWIKAMYR